MEPAGPYVGEEFSYPVDDVTLDDMEARDTAADTTPKLKLHHDLREKHGVKVFSYVRRLHKNMGHPSRQVLTRMLRERMLPGMC